MNALEPRVLALQALCLFDAIGDGFRKGLDAFLSDTANYADLDWRRRPRPKVLAQARSLVAGAWEQHARYDQLLNEQVAGWSVERMQPVDRNILRLGLHELLECPETPHQVVLNEAIELARRFGGAESPAFVNGVLDGIRRKQGALPAFRGTCQDDLGTSGQPADPDLSAAADKEA